MKNKNYRINTNIIKDKVLNVNLEQDVDFLEVLSLKINQEDTYKLHSSNYGVIVGRVLANEAFGIPNAKVSLFITLDDADKMNSEITNLYPYTSITSTDKNGVRYNLLPDSSNDICYKIVGTFPSKRLVLDEDTVLEVFEKYWKYTTVTNKAGDYMIFGVPVGTQQIHVDIDLSDIGILSQKPRDMIYKGYNITQFENSNQFKESTNLDGLTQLYAQNESVYVYPFWGDTTMNEVAITRSDIQIQYKFEPTCVFIGSVITDSFSNNIGHNCTASKFSGFNRTLITNEGTIEMIRKTVDGLVEEFQIQGNRLINGDGVWCYQIPMNLDYVATDEYGNIIPTDNPKKGIPTRTSVRFRISLQESESDSIARHRAKYLVPNSPKLVDNEVVPKIDNSKNFDNIFEFGSATPDDCYRDLYWNKVYSIKNYIPRIQNNNKESAQNYNALRSTNMAESSNPIPFNKVRFRMIFAYRLLCMIMTIVVYIITIINGFFSGLQCICLPWPLKICPFKWVTPECIRFSVGITEDEDDNIEYFPGCAKCGKSSCEKPNCTKNNDARDLVDTIQQSLSQEYDVVNMDFYNDWLNGTLYHPLWFWKKTKKKNFFFGLFSRKAVNSYCGCSKNFPRLRVIFPCSLTYSDENLNYSDGDRGDKWHTITNRALFTNMGVIKEVENDAGLRIYYYAPGVPTDFNYKNTAENVSYVRLYSTDIILLGSMNNCDLDGLPQPFINLPSTTANIPFIVSVKQGGEEEGATYLEGTTKEQGLIEVTGMDWLNNGDNKMPKYGQGLLFDLSCSDVYTKPKTCVNIERMCEYGVSLDIFYQNKVSKNGDVYTNDMKADGMITRYELDDTDTRSMFASLNHNGLSEKVFNKNTGYDAYKLQYIYPVDFDGRMNSYSQAYTSGMPFKTYDYRDMSYVNYRLGPGGRHFYFKGSGYEFPLYNNSFYFYFGLHEGSTAIDKFNEQFFSTCYKNTKYPFLMTIDKTPAKWCIKDGAYNTDYGMLQITLDSIKVPYSYSLYDSFNTELISESNMYNLDLVFGAKVKDGGGEYEKNEDGTYKKEGRLMYFNNGAFVTPQQVLYNNSYKLTITDSKGQNVTQIISLEQNPINMTYNVYGLGTAYYDGETKIGDICTDNALYGNIVIRRIIIDGKEYSITSVISMGNGKYNLMCKYDTDNYQVLLELTPILNSLKFTDCVCDTSTTVPSYVFNKEDGSITFNIWIPGDYNIRLTQYCNGVLNDNVSNIVVNVSNGKLFELFMNNIPMRFILGKNEETSAYNNNFYRNTVNSPSDLPGWFNLHREEAYVFPPLTKTYLQVWENYTGNIEKDDNNLPTDEGKMTVIQYKFESLFSLSNSAYVTEVSESIFQATHKGGKSPILYRGIYPMYDQIKGDETLEEPLNRYIADSAGYTACDTQFSNIVGFNYGQNNNDGTVSLINPNIKTPYFNLLLSDQNNVKNLGNYFAVFTQNGGIIADGDDSCKIDTKLKYQQAPNKADNLFKVEGTINCPDGDGIEVQNIPNNVIVKVGNTNPYFRAEFVDKRMDYDLIIMTPYSGDDIDIPDNGGGKSDLWRLGRFSGTSINGIEMAYNTNYTVISPKQDAGTEYSYDLSNAKTLYNTSNQAKLNRRYYKSQLRSGGKTTDLRNFSWSTFRDPIKLGTNMDSTKGVYSLNHSTDTSLFNGDFDANNYPIKRLYDVGNIPNGDKLSFSGASCSYRVKMNRNDDGSLGGVVESGEESTFDVDCRNMITPSSSSLEECVNGDRFNLLFESSGSGILNFTPKLLNLRFSVKNDNFNSTHLCQTKLPKFMSVKNRYVTNSIDLIKRELSLATIENTINKFSFDTKIVSNMDNITVHDDKYFYDNDGNRIFDDGSDFKKLVFSSDINKVSLNSRLWHGGTIGEVFNLYNGLDVSNIDVFSLLVDRKYFNSNRDNLYKSIRAIEFGSLYDCRGFTFGLIEIKEVEYEEVDESGTTVIVITQSLRFRLDFSADQASDVFKKYTNLALAFKFKLKNGDTYVKNDITVEPIDLDAEGNPTKLDLTVLFNGAMSKIMVNNKTAPMSLQVFIKTTNGLVYAFACRIKPNKTITSDSRGLDIDIFD